MQHPLPPTLALARMKIDGQGRKNGLFDPPNPVLVPLSPCDGMRISSGSSEPYASPLPVPFWRFLLTTTICAGTLGEAHWGLLGGRPLPHQPWTFPVTGDQHSLAGLG